MRGMETSVVACFQLTHHYLVSTSLCTLLPKLVPMGFVTTRKRPRDCITKGVKENKKMSEHNKIETGFSDPGVAFVHEKRLKL